MNKAFVPSKIRAYNSHMEFGFVPRTGMCLPNKDVENCQHLNKDVVYYEPVPTVEVDKEENEKEIDIMEAIKESNNEGQSVEDYVNQLLATQDLDNDFADEYPDQMVDPQGGYESNTFDMQYVRHENTIGDTVDPIVRDQDTKDHVTIEELRIKAELKAKKEAEEQARLEAEAAKAKKERKIK